MSRQEHELIPAEETEYVHPATQAIYRHLAHLPDHLDANTLKQVTETVVRLREQDRLDNNQAAENARLKDRDEEASRQAASDRRFRLVQLLTRPTCALSLWVSGTILMLHGQTELGATLLGAGTTVMIGARFDKDKTG